MTMNRIEVFSTADMHNLCESARQQFESDATFLDNQGTAIIARVALGLTQEGLDGERARMLGISIWGTSAGEKIARPLKQAHDHLETAAKFVAGAHRAWITHFKVPMEISQQQRRNGANARAARI